MILRIRNSRIGKGTSLLMAGLMLVTLYIPTPSYGLTGGPAQPEFTAFTPIGVSDMVDLTSGDFSYNIPLMDVGGFPINLAYNSGVTMDQEASWVGLGWNLNVGQINRQERGLPDDFNGDKMTYIENQKPNQTVGGMFKFKPHLFGVGKKDGANTDDGLSFSTGLGIQYNTYTGASITPSAGITYQVNDNVSLGLSVKSTPEGLNVNPNVSLNAKGKNEQGRNTDLSVNAGVSFNSRQGVRDYNMSASTNVVQTYGKENVYQVEGSSSRSTGSVISAVPNTFTPTVRQNYKTESGTFNASFGTEIYGLEGDATIQGFQTVQYIENTTNEERAYGYDNVHQATEEDVLDFNREKDGVFSTNSTNLPITNYTYDFYSVQGQGVSGMFRPYRSQVGFVYDNEVKNSSTGLSGGAEIGVGSTAHSGGDVEVTSTRSKSGIWKKRNDALESFEPNETEDPRYEEVYFKNVGDMAVDNDIDIYGDEDDRLGGYNPARLRVSGLPYLRKLDNTYEIKNSDATAAPETYDIIKDDIKRHADKRLQRNQAILKVSALEAETIGYTFQRNPHTDVKDHHTAGFIITRNDGARYNYGRALYNYDKQEVTFAVGEGFGGDVISGLDGSCETGLVSYFSDGDAADNSINNPHGDHYFSNTITPAYAHTFLLTSILSNDYSDVDGTEGPSVGDFGSYTLFTYFEDGEDWDDNTAGIQAFDSEYRWRFPFQEDEATFNEGFKTDPTDDRASYIYGEKEVRYIREIRTKTHIAIFHISERADAFGVEDENGGFASDVEKSRKFKLSKISLYSIGEYFEPDGVTEKSNPTPIKEVHFEYTYDLCQGVPNNKSGMANDHDGDGVLGESVEWEANNGGKLTLRRVYFTYRNSNLGKYTDYEFTYGDADHNGTEDSERNPNYGVKDYDIWGCYKPNDGTGCNSHEEIPVPEFNYVDQDDPNNDDYTSAWCMTDISLPSGGKIQVDYESDSYQYVQDKEVMEMFKLAGAGNTPTTSDPSFKSDFAINPTSIVDEASPLYYDGVHAEYLYLDIPDGMSASTFESNYIDPLPRDDEGRKLIYFRTALNMNRKGGKTNDLGEKYPYDYVTGYFVLDESVSATVFSDGGNDYASIKMTMVDMEKPVGSNPVNPISKAGWHFARKYLSKYVYGLPELDETLPIDVMLESLYQMGENLVETFVGPNAILSGKHIAQRFIPEKSWIRLGASSTDKLGGGCRVNRIAMTDEWATMIDEPVDGISDQEYGQTYDYTLEDGTSSGVATYEPVGSKENPYVQPVFSTVDKVLAPDEENFMEKPFGEMYFPNPKVTYARVTVQNLERTQTGEVVRRNATGRVVTEHYTCRDYPTIVDQTELHIDEDHNPLLAGLLPLNVKNHITLSQGYLIHLNDMDGRMKAQYVYGEGQDEYISGVRYKYDLNDPDEPSGTGVGMGSNNKGLLDNVVKAIYPNGIVGDRTIGVEYDIVNDFREMRSVVDVGGMNINAATFIVGTVPVTVPALVPDFNRHEDKLRMSTTTKVIHSYGILRETEAFDAGASVKTKNLLWDSETGEVLLTETVNEYGDKYYSMSFPAHWYYKGMGNASFNTGLAIGATPTASSGIAELDPSLTASDYLFNGDEVYMLKSSSSGFELVPAWVTDVGVSASNEIKLLNEDGGNADMSSMIGLKVIRSGKRNHQSTSMASVTMQVNPLDFLVAAGSDFTLPDGFLDATSSSTNKLVNAGAVEFSDDWDFQCECNYDPVYDTYNPYVFNTKGVWRTLRSWLYLAGRNHPGSESDPRNHGFFNDFLAFYGFNAGTWDKDISGWTTASTVTQFSPFGFELENVDALDRYSAAQYGYNTTFPMAVGANTQYQEIGFDGFEDYLFTGCPQNEHFGFRDDPNLTIDPESADPNIISDKKSHTGRYSLKVAGGGKIKKLFRTDCDDPHIP